MAEPFVMRSRMDFGRGRTSTSYCISGGSGPAINLATSIARDSWGAITHSSQISHKMATDKPSLYAYEEIRGRTPPSSSTRPSSLACAPVQAYSNRHQILGRDEEMAEGNRRRYSSFCNLMGSLIADLPSSGDPRKKQKRLV